MPRPRNIIRTHVLQVMLPDGVREALDTYLRENGGNIPVGAYQKFFVARILETLSSEEFDLAPYLGTAPGVFLVRGNRAVILMLEAHLKADQDTQRLGTTECSIS